MDSYQPKGLPFSQHYPGTSRPFEDPDREEDEGDIVKSKPKSNPYLPLVNESALRGEETPKGRGEGAQGYQHSQEVHVHVKEPPNGRIPIAESIMSSSETGGGSGAGVTLGSAGLGSAEKPPPPQQATITTQKTKDGDGASEDDKENIEVSTAALLRRYTLERNGRPTSIHLGPSGEMVGSGWLSEILVTNHKKCSVTLEEDYITWRYLSRKDCELFLTFLFPV